MPFLKRIASLVRRSINQAASIIQKAEVTLHLPDEALRALPAPLANALTALGTPLDGATVKRPKLMLASAAKGRVPSPVGAVGISTDAAGRVQWHLPRPGGSLQVWVDRAAAEGRKVVTATLTGRGDAALDELRDFERRLWNKPAMKLLPAQSQDPAAPMPPQLPNVLGLQFQDGQSPPIPGGEPILVLVHGIFDRVYGAAFSPLLLWGDLLGRFQRRYGGRVYGFDHETVSVDPLQNAKDLIALLPVNTPIDILCHSRGGLVVRALLQHPDLDKSRAHLTFRNVIFMGAANEGSPLAERRNFEDLLTVFTGMLRERPPANEPEGHFKLLLTALRVLLAPALDLPGIADLRPDSRLIKKLSGAALPPKLRYDFIRANFGGAAGLGLQALEPISNRVFGTALHDLVVPFNGMTAMGGAPPQNEPETLDHAVTPQGHVYHLNYLDQPRVRQRITQFLGVP
jgi:hypothetical protein